MRNSVGQRVAPDKVIDIRIPSDQISMSLRLCNCFVKKFTELLCKIVIYNRIRVVNERSSFTQLFNDPV